MTAFHHLLADAESPVRPVLELYADAQNRLMSPCILCALLRCVANASLSHHTELPELDKAVMAAPKPAKCESPPSAEFARHPWTPLNCTACQSMPICAWTPAGASAQSTRTYRGVVQR
jgi:hypothetical protein